MHHRGGDDEAHADAHRAVAAGIEPVPRLRIEQLGPADIHRAGAFADDDRVLRRPGGDVFQRAVVVGGRRVVDELGRDLRRIRRRFCGNRGVPGRVLGIDPLALFERLVELPDDRLAVADQPDLGRRVLADRLRGDVQLDDAHVLVEARRQTEMHDPVQPCAHQEDDVGILERVAAGRPDRQRMAVGHHPLAHRRGEERQLGALDEGADLVLGAGVGHALADDDERPLGRPERVQRALDILRHGLRARRVRAARRLVHDQLVDLSGDDVVRHVEIARAGPAVDRVSDRHLDVERDAVDVLDRMRELAERRRDQHLALFLERPHAVAPGFRRAANEDHRPAILLRIGEAGEGVDDAGARHDEASARAPGQIADGLRRIRGGLLVAHPDIGDPFLLRGRGDRAHRKPDDPEHELDALPFEAPRH